MATLTADSVRAKRGRPDVYERYAIETGATIYVGSSAMLVHATGRVKKGASATAQAATSVQAAGVVVKLEGSSGIGSGVGDTSGTEYAYIEAGNEHLFALDTAIRTASALRKNVYYQNDSDNEAAGTSCAATSGSWVPMGQLTAFEASDKSTGWVRVGHFGKTDVTT